MKTTFKPFHIVAGIFALLLFSSVVTSHIEETTGQEVSPIVLSIGVVSIGAVSISFARIKKGEAAYASIVANIFDMTQLQIKDIIMAAIYSHYGWRQNGAGKWERGPNSRVDLPSLPEEARIIRNDLFQIQYLTPTETTFEFFNKAQDPSKEFFSNVLEATPNKEELNVFFGITAEHATGAGAADTPDILSFGAPAAGEDEVLNGLVSYEINNRKELVKQPWKEKFVNEDPIPNYFRFPKALVWEPGNGQVLTLKLAKAYAAATHKFAKFSLLGYKLTR